MKLAPALLALLLTACGGGGDGGTHVTEFFDNTHVYLDSLNGQRIQIPREGSSVNYVTMGCGGTTFDGKKLVRMTYRIDAASGVKIFTAEKSKPDQTSTSLYFQRAGDNWSADGKYETYRWFGGRFGPLVAGERTIEASLVDGPWRAIFKSTLANNPSAFVAAKENCMRLGFVLGGTGGLGHGIWATGEASITVLSYEVL